MLLRSRVTSVRRWRGQQLARRAGGPQRRSDPGRARRRPVVGSAPARGRSRRGRTPRAAAVAMIRKRAIVGLGPPGVDRSAGQMDDVARPGVDPLVLHQQRERAVEHDERLLVGVVAVQRRARSRAASAPRSARMRRRSAAALTLMIHSPPSPHSASPASAAATVGSAGAAAIRRRRAACEQRRVDPGAQRRRPRPAARSESPRRSWRRARPRATFCAAADAARACCRAPA